MAQPLLDVDGIGDPFILAPPDTEMKKMLDDAQSLLARKPEILQRISADQDAWGLAKKELRQADQRWAAAQTLPLPGVAWEELPSMRVEALSLLEGRPRMPAEVVYVFSLLRGYLGSLTDKQVQDRLVDSTTLQWYLHQRGLFFPGWSTLVENVNAISNETRSLMLDAQLEIILGEGLDDFLETIVDSTAIEANSAWPTDSRLLLGLLERAFRRSQKLDAFGLDNLPTWWMPKWLEKLAKLHFRINNVAGKARSKGKLKKYYRQFLRTTQKMLEYLMSECVARAPLEEAPLLAPSRRLLLDRLWERLVGDISDACAVYQYTEERIFEGIVQPAEAKKLSLSDESAAFIEKGQRQSVIGYKPQLGRSGGGFVTALQVPPGNAADAPQLVPLMDEVQQRTGILPKRVSADDGYTSEEGRTQLLKKGVEDVSFSGSKGKQLIPEDDWESEVYQQLRRGRSAVESLIFVLKHCFAFGRLRRRGLEEVRAELLEKVIAYNFVRMGLVRQAQQETPFSKAA